MLYSGMQDENREVETSNAMVDAGYRAKRVIILTRDHHSHVPLFTRSSGVNYEKGLRSDYCRDTRYFFCAPPVLYYNLPSLRTRSSYKRACRIVERIIRAAKYRAIKRHRRNQKAPYCYRENQTARRMMQ